MRPIESTAIAMLIVSAASAERVERILRFYRLYVMSPLYRDMMVEVNAELALTEIRTMGIAARARVEEILTRRY